MLRLPIPLYALSVATLTVAGACAQSATQGPESTAEPMAPPLIISGAVQIATPNDGAPLPSDLRITVDCHHGDFFDGGSTSQSGQFRFKMTPSALAVASDSICAAEARAFGYDSSTARFTLRSGSGMIDIGLLTIQRNATGDTEARNKRTGQTVSATSLKAPPNAVKLFDHGSRSLQQGKFANAAKDFEGAIKIYPDYAECWLALGSARVSLGTPGPAREAFLQAAKLDPQMAGPPAELGLLAVRQNDLVSAAQYLDESLRLDPGGSYQTCYSDALVNLFLKRYDVAERSARAALSFGENAAHARADYVLGIALLVKGVNGEAREHLLRYLELAPKAPERDQIMKDLSRVEAAK